LERDLPRAAAAYHVTAIDDEQEGVMRTKAARGTAKGRRD
jgi:hypothetical protein